MPAELDDALRRPAPTSAPRTDFHRPVHCLLGLPIDAVTLDESIARLKVCAETRTRCFFSTPNLNFVIAAQTDPVFRDSILCSDFSVADGMPLVWVARLLGIPMRERVSGASVFETLRTAAGRPMSVYFFGGPDGVAQKAAAVIAAQDTAMTCVGYQSPGFGTVEDMSGPEVLDPINASAPDFVVVALGARKGQTWIRHNLARLDAPIASHLGAVVNFVAGTVRRAPRLWQRLGIEWVWRILQEPHLWKRYAGDGLGLARLLVTEVMPAWIDVRFRRPSPVALNRATLTESHDADGTSAITLAGPWTRQNAAPLRDAFTRATVACTDLRVDLDAVEYLDSTCIALLMLLRGHQTRCGGALRIHAGAHGAAHRMLRNNGALFLLDDDPRGGPAR